MPTAMVEIIKINELYKFNYKIGLTNDQLSGKKKLSQQTSRWVVKQINGSLRDLIVHMVDEINFQDGHSAIQ